MDEEYLWKQLRAGRLHREQLSRPLGEPALQVVPQLQPASMEDVARTPVVLAEFGESGAIGDQFACLCAEIHGVVGVHVWRVCGSEQPPRVFVLTAGRKPFRGLEKGALGAI